MNGQAQAMGMPQPMLQGNPLPQGAPPQRPRREGDEEYRRAMSPPEVTINGTPNTSSSSPTNESVVTPNGDVVAPVARRRSMSPPPPGHVASHTVHPNLRNTRSPPPQLRVGEDGRPALPPDAFYFSGKSPTGGSRPGSLLGRPGSILGRPGSIIGNRPGSVAGTADLLREIKARETEADNAKRREGALRVLLSKAIEQGFVVDDEAADIPPPDLLGDNEQLRHVALALKQLKQEKANLQNEVTQQMQLASDKIQDAERMQKASLQEAAYYRAKLAALESGDMPEASKIDANRIADLERQLESTTTEHIGGQRELERLKSEVAHHQKICNDATEAETETLKRAEVAEEEIARLQEEVETLRDQVANHDRSTRDQTERFITLTSTHQQREAERDDYKTQLDDLRGKNDEFAQLLEQATASMAATNLRADQFETMHGQAKEQITVLEQELAEIKRALEDKTREAEQATARLAETEGLHTSAREEVTNYRSLTSGRLGELLESHRAIREDNTRGVKGHQDQLRALEEEKGSLLKLLRDAGERVDATEAVASSHRKKARELEQQHQTLRGDMRAQRTKLVAAQNELAKYRNLFTNKDSELRERDQAVTELQTRVSLMRKLLGEHGINVSDADLDSAETSSAGELESKLRDKSRAHDTAQREIDELKRRCQEAEDKSDSLARMVERYKDARSPSAGSIHSGDGEGGDASQRARDAERKLAEAEDAHQKRLTALQSDYETAVRYVKGTEKMLKRMKDELNKQKATNTTLLSELDGMRGRSGSPLTRGLSGRTTPSDGELTRKIQTLQNQYTSLQAELQASQDTLNARNREWDLLRARVEDNERENEALREDLAQAHHRIETLLEINPAGITLGSDDEDDRLGGLRRGSTASSDGGASMAFDKVS
jgi:chromosome segregation ATPase